MVTLITLAINKYMRNKAYTFQLNPTNEQLTQLCQHAGACRWLWNHMLSENTKRYELEKKFNFQFVMNNLIPKLKEKYNWLKEINSQSLQQRNRDLDIALKRSFKKHGFPKFKKKSDSKDSFRVPQSFKLNNKSVYLPKIGWVKWKVNRKIESKVKSITIKQDLDKWVAVVLCELPEVEKRASFADSEVTGIDVGIKDFAVLSNGTKIENPKHLEKSEKLLKRNSRKLSKKVKGSNNRNKARKQLAKLHGKIKNQRKDFQWKLANEITNQYQVICMENLNIKGMVKNRRLSKSISSVGWGMFKQKIEHKLADTGGLLINIDRFAPSSKMCSSCGALNDNLTLKDRGWNCSCGAKHDRDINAAINIKMFGLKEINRLGTSRIYACGETNDGGVAIDASSYVSLKQENCVIGHKAIKLNV